MSTLSDIKNGNYNHCDVCSNNNNGTCTKLNKDISTEMVLDQKVDDCPKKSGRYRWN